MRRVIFILALLANLVFAGELKKLTFEQVFENKGESLTRAVPGAIKWADDEHYYLKKSDKLYSVHAATGKSRLVLDPGKYKDILGSDFNLLSAEDRTPDLEKFLFLKDDDIFLFLRKANKLVRVTRTADKEKTPEFSPDGKRIAFTAGGNLYYYDIAAGQIQKSTADGCEEILNGFASWIYYEEILGRRSRYKAFWWSPDSKKIVFMRFDQGKVPIFSITRADGVYGELEKQRYPKPGFPNPAVRIGIADVTKNETTWIDFNDPADHYLAFPTWNEAADRVYFQWMNREQNHLRLLVYDLQTQTIRIVYEEKQPAWVEFMEAVDFRLLKNHDIVLRSPKDGWYHIYYLSHDGREQRVTAGEWSVTNLDYVDQDSKTIYFSAGREDSTENDFYKTDYSGKEIVKLTDFKGFHRVTVSPTAKKFIDSYSSIQAPTRLEIRSSLGKMLRQIADSASPALKEYDLAKVELFRIATNDGYKLPALWLLPPGFDKTRKYPVVFSIYGGPGAPSVRNTFPSRDNFFLAQQDIIVFVVDHRGSGHFGKKGVDLMHRCLGKWEMHDYIQAVEYLKRLPFVDLKRIGITGGSYGGYATALALTKEAEVFSYGIAAFSVIDWQLYDSVYTERYMDTPAENPDGYKISSVLNYIDSLKSGSIRITHGTMDDNVHAQNTIQFVDKALNAGKSLELMLYPGDRHGYSGLKQVDSDRGDINFWLRKFYGKELKILQ